MALRFRPAFPEVVFKACDGRRPWRIAHWAEIARWFGVLLSHGVSSPRACAVYPVELDSGSWTM